MKIIIFCIVVCAGIGFFFLHQVSNQKLTINYTEPLAPAAQVTPKPAETKDIEISEVKAALMFYLTACINSIASKDATSGNLSSENINNAIKRSALLQRETVLKQSTVACLAEIARANNEYKNFIAQCEKYKKWDKTSMQTEADFKKSTELLIYNATRSWELKKQQYTKKLDLMRVQIEQAFSSLQSKTVDKTDAFAQAVLASSTQEKRNQWIRQNGKQLSIEVIQVLPHGVLADQMESRAGRGSYMSSIGGGGGAPVSYDAPSGKIIFVDGLKGMVDGQRKSILAAKEGTYAYRDVQGANRTVEKWTIIEE
jgi:hypothetical protein